MRHRAVRRSRCAHLPRPFLRAPPRAHRPAALLHPSTGNVIYGICFLFSEPNPDDPLNMEASKLMRENREAFERNVAASLRGGQVDGVSFVRQLK